jgi:RHS repeat-associated protein
MYDEKGQTVWETRLDIYGKVHTFAGRSLNDCPFRYQGMYEDSETGLYYNYHRYYDPESGNYISQDPAGLVGNNPTLYAYVHDPNSWIDPFGLDLHHIIPNQIYRQYSTAFDKVGGYAQNISKTGIDKSNLINLNTPFHGNHPKYNDYVRGRVGELVRTGNLNLKSIKELQREMHGHIKNAQLSGKTLNDYFKEGYHLKNKTKCH